MISKLISLVNPTKQFIVRMEPNLVKEVDRLVRDDRLYRSRNEFFRDAVRARLIEIRAVMIEEKAKPMIEKLRKRGYRPRMMTQEEKQKAADEYLGSKGIDAEEFK